MRRTGRWRPTGGEFARRQTPRAKGSLEPRWILQYFPPVAFLYQRALDATRFQKRTLGAEENVMNHRDRHPDGPATFLWIDFPLQILFGVFAKLSPIPSTAGRRIFTFDMKSTVLRAVPTAPVNAPHPSGGEGSIPFTASVAAVRRREAGTCPQHTNYRRETTHADRTRRFRRVVSSAHSRSLDAGRNHLMDLLIEGGAEIRCSWVSHRCPAP